MCETEYISFLFLSSIVYSNYIEMNSVVSKRDCQKFDNLLKLFQKFSFIKINFWMESV